MLAATTEVTQPLRSKAHSQDWIWQWRGGQDPGTPGQLFLSDLHVLVCLYPPCPLYITITLQLLTSDVYTFDMWSV